MFRYGLIAALAGSDEVEIVGEAADGRELLAVTDEKKPDVVLTDLAMPHMDGAAATAAILARHPNVAVLVLSMHEDDEALLAALRAGARGYLLKGADRTEIIRAVLTVDSGEAIYGAASPKAGPTSSSAPSARTPRTGLRNSPRVNGKYST
jgi:DNA-binding NarL/FixJ family response regulator